AIRRKALVDAALDPEDRDVERAAAEVIDRDDAVVELVEPVRERRGRRLVHDAHDVEPRDAPRVLRRLALAVVEVGRYRDDGPLDRLAEVGLGALLERPEHDRLDLRRGDFAPADHDPDDSVLRLYREREVPQLLLNVAPAAAHEPLDRVHVRVRLADEPP